MAVGSNNLRTMFLLAAAVAFLLLATWEGLWNGLGVLYPDLGEYIYPRVSMWRLILQHLLLVGVSSTLSIFVGVGLGILVTRRFGRDFLPAVSSLVSVGQTFPPVAVLALAVPAVGFGAAPTIIALFLYGLLPIVRGTIAGLESVGPDIREAAKGMGMTELQSLVQVEMPLASGVIMAGIKTSVVINIGTATIGATIGAGGLGAPIITGLASDNPAFILQGSVMAALFAILADGLLDRFATGKGGAAS